MRDLKLNAKRESTMMKCLQSDLMIWLGLRCGFTLREYEWSGEKVNEFISVTNGESQRMAI